MQLFLSYFHSKVIIVNLYIFIQYQIWIQSQCLFVYISVIDFWANTDWNCLKPIKEFASDKILTYTQLLDVGFVLHYDNTRFLFFILSQPLY